MGKNTLGICDRSGIKTKLSKLVSDGYNKGLMVLPDYRDTSQPQERPVRLKERIAVKNPVPDRDNDGTVPDNLAATLFPDEPYFGGGT